MLTTEVSVAAGFVAGILFVLVVNAVSNIPSPWEIRIERLREMAEAVREQETRVKREMEIRAIAREEIVKFYLKKEAE